MARIIDDYYKGMDLYSDGEVENTLLNHFSGDSDNNCESSLLYFYHTAEMRKGLLNWYEFKPNSTIVEVGGGCGALTGLLCEKASKVITIELSKKRAEIIKNRHKDKDNLDIYVANINDVKDFIKADYIVVVGVLEYQETYGEVCNNPYIDFLTTTREMLKKDGKLLLAIENRFGIKYWAGAPEDHTRIPYDGISNYRYGGKAKTFTKNDLEFLLKQAGYLYNYFYYPMPDYRLVEEVYSDDYMPCDNWGLAISPYYGEYMDSLLVPEKALYKDLFRNGIFGVFANSFLVEAGVSEIRFCDVIYAKSNINRAKKYKITTTIHNDNTVRKEAIATEAMASLECCIKCANQINSRKSKNIKAVEINKISNHIESPYLSYPLILNEMLKSIEFNDENKFEWLLERYYNAILESSEIEEVSKKYGTIMKILYIEMTPSNCLVDYKTGKIYVYDLEAAVENKPANFMIFRALEYLEILVNDFSFKFSLEKYKKKYGLEGVWEEYQEWLNVYYDGLNGVEGVDDLLPFKNAQIIDVEKMDFNVKLISYLGTQLQNQVEREYRRTERIKALMLNNDESVRERFKNFEIGQKINADEVTYIPWGIGECFKRNINVLLDLMNIKYAYDSNKKNWGKRVYEDIVCLSEEELVKIKNPVIIIMVDDVKNAFDIELKIKSLKLEKYFHISSVLSYLEV